MMIILDPDSPLSVLLNFLAQCINEIFEAISNNLALTGVLIFAAVCLWLVPGIIQADREEFEQREDKDKP